MAFSISEKYSDAGDLNNPFLEYFHLRPGEMVAESLRASHSVLGSREAEESAIRVHSRKSPLRRCRPTKNLVVDIAQELVHFVRALSMIKDSVAIGIVTFKLINKAKSPQKRQFAVEYWITHSFLTANKMMVIHTQAVKSVPILKPNV